MSICSTYRFTKLLKLSHSSCSYSTMQQIHLHVIDIFIAKYDAEIQTEIDNSTIYIKKYNKKKNKICNTPKKHTQMWRLQQKKNILLGFHLKH